MDPTARVMDAHSSFSYLVDNLPSWRKDIDALSAHAAQKNTEFVAEYVRLVHQIRPKRKKSPSVSSVHTNDDGQLTNASRSVHDVPSPPEPVEINPLEAGNKYLYAQARRKRKLGPSIRSGASGPQKFRTKNQVVVYYDSHLQEKLNDMVKSIGVGRNNLRKGKNAFAASRGFQLPTLPRRAGQGFTSLENIRRTMVSPRTSALLPGKKPDGIIGQPSSDAETSFLQVDKELELIQSLCETAAHQFLRDGDCKAELDTIQQKLDQVFSQAAAAAETLKKLKDETKDTANLDAEHTSTSLDNNHSWTDSDATLSTQPSFDVLNTPKIGATTDPSPLAIARTLEDMKSRGAFFSAPAIPTDDNHAGMMTDNIEVDDASDQSSINVDISAYRLMNPRRTRV